MVLVARPRLGPMVTAALFLAHAPAMTVAQLEQVSISQLAFGPASITIHAGDGVAWTNHDGAPHGVTFTDGSAGTQMLRHGQTFSRIFDRAGTYAYFSAGNPDMTGEVVVMPD